MHEAVKVSGGASNVADFLKDAMLSQRFTDVALCCPGGRRFLAHRLVISAASPFLREVLLAHSKSSNQCEPITVILAEIEAPELTAILGFVYTGNASVPRERFDAFLRAAKALHIRLPPLPPVINDFKQKKHYENSIYLNSLHKNNEKIVEGQENTEFRCFIPSKFYSQEVLSNNDTSKNSYKKSKVDENLGDSNENTLNFERRELLINQSFIPLKSVTSGNSNIFLGNDPLKGIQKKCKVDEKLEESVRNSAEFRKSRDLVNEHMKLFQSQDWDILSTNKFSKNVKTKNKVDQGLDKFIDSPELGRRQILISQLESFTSQNSAVLSTDEFPKVQREFNFNQNLEKSIKNSTEFGKLRFQINNPLESFKSQSSDILSNNKALRKVEQEFRIDESFDQSFENSVNLEESRFLINKDFKPIRIHKLHHQNISSTETFSNDIQKEFKIDKNLEKSTKDLTYLEKERFPIMWYDKSFTENESKNVFQRCQFDSESSRKLWTKENLGLTVLSSQISSFDRMDALETRLEDISRPPMSSLLGLRVGKTEKRVKTPNCEEDCCTWRMPRMQVANRVTASPWKQTLRPHHSPRSRPIPAIPPAEDPDKLSSGKSFPVSPTGNFLYPKSTLIPHQMINKNQTTNSIDEISPNFWDFEVGLEKESLEFESFKKTEGRNENFPLHSAQLQISHPVSRLYKSFDLIEQEKDNFSRWSVEKMMDEKGKMSLEASAGGDGNNNNKEIFEEPLTKAKNSEDHKCEQCGKCFVTRASLKVHGRTHSGEKPFRCADCGKQFSQLRNYKYHRSIHEGTREFATTCPECGKNFNDRGYLSSHMKIHRNRKEYGCSECGKSFNQRVAYNMHARIHTGLKPHQCEQCGKAFSRKMLLKQHLRTHSGERPYHCQVCHKAFADRSNMTLHTRLHSGLKPYQCTLCTKAFTKKHHLKTHLNYHTGIKPYSCPNCALKFSQSSNMRTHYKKCAVNKSLEKKHEEKITQTLTPPNSDQESSILTPTIKK